MLKSFCELIVTIIKWLVYYTIIWDSHIAVPALNNTLQCKTEAHHPEAFIMIHKVPADIELHAYPSSLPTAKSRSKLWPPTCHKRSPALSSSLDIRVFVFTCCFQSQTVPSQQDRKCISFVNPINEEANFFLHRVIQRGKCRRNEVMETFLSEMTVLRNKN